MIFSTFFVSLCNKSYIHPSYKWKATTDNTKQGDTRRIQKAVHAAATDALSRGIQDALRQV